VSELHKYYIIYIQYSISNHNVWQNKLLICDRLPPPNSTQLKHIVIVENVQIGQKTGQRISQPDSKLWLTCHEYSLVDDFSQEQQYFRGPEKP
jgi:hypothetical protein